MILAKDEELLKEWDYATAIVGAEKTTYSLTVTNKRIISQSKSKRKNTRKEIPIENVRSFSCGSETKSMLGPILLIVFGVLLIVASIILFFKTDIGVYVLAGCLVGIIFLVMGIRRLKQGAFVLTIETCGYSGTLKLGAIHMFESIFESVFSKRVKVDVNNEVAEEIVEVLGSLIF